MRNKNVSRRSFLGNLLKTAGLAVVAPIVRFIPESESLFGKTGLERQVAKSIGLTGQAQDVFVEGIKVQQLLGTALRSAISEAKQHPDSQTILSFLHEQQHQRQHTSAMGITVESFVPESPGSATLLMWDHRGAADTQFARVACALDSESNIVQVGVGLIEILPTEDAMLQLYEIEDGNLVHKGHLQIDKSGNVVDDNYTSRAIAASDDCLTCQQVCGILYGGSCSIGGVVACTLICIPFANLACPLICGTLYTIICIIGTFNNCNLICEELGYC